MSIKIPKEFLLFCSYTFFTFWLRLSKIILPVIIQKKLTKIATFIVSKLLYVVNTQGDKVIHDSNLTSDVLSYMCVIVYFSIFYLGIQFYRFSVFFSKLHF